MVKKFSKNYKSKRRSKKSKRQPRQVNTTWSGPTNQGIVPKTYVAKLRYVEEITLNSGLAAYAVHRFHANSLFDPDLTGGGHQPYGFDTLMSMYNHFTVIGSKITVKPVLTTTANVIPGYLVVTCSDNGTRVADAYTSGGVPFVMESLGTTRPILVGREALDTKLIAISTFSAKKFFGVSSIVGQDLYRGNSAANPTELSFFEIAHMAAGANDPGSLTFMVTIDYTAVFSERKNLSIS